MCVSPEDRPMIRGTDLNSSAHDAGIKNTDDGEAQVTDDASATSDSNAQVHDVRRPLISQSSDDVVVQPIDNGCADDPEDRKVDIDNNANTKPYSCLRRCSFNTVMIAGFIISLIGVGIAIAVAANTAEPKSATRMFVNASEEESAMSSNDTTVVWMSSIDVVDQNRSSIDVVNQTADAATRSHRQTVTQTSDVAASSTEHGGHTVADDASTSSSSGVEANDTTVTTS